MKIEFSPMQTFLRGRDAAFYCHADVYSASGVRHPVRLMIEGVSIASFRSDNDEQINDIVEAMYRNELKTLLATGKLIPETSAGRLLPSSLQMDTRLHRCNLAISSSMNS
jgi:hypothetical protein